MDTNTNTVETETNMAAALEAWDETAEAERKAAEPQAKPKTPLKDAFDDWADTVEQDQAAARNAAARREPIAIAMTEIKDQILGYLDVRSGEKTRVIIHDEQQHGGFGYSLRRDIEKGEININIEKEFPSSGYSYKRTHYVRAPIGILITAHFRDGTGYGRDHESRSQYKAKIDGTWNSKALQKRIAEKMAQYEAQAERKREIARIENDQMASKEELATAISATLGVKVEGLGETVTDYSTKWGHGRYGTKTDDTVRKFGCDIAGRRMVIRFKDKEDTVSSIIISGEKGLTQDQVKQLADLLSTF